MKNLYYTTIPYQAVYKFMDSDSVWPLGYIHNIIIIIIITTVTPGSHRPVSGADC